MSEPREDAWVREQLARLEDPPGPFLGPEARRRAAGRQRRGQLRALAAMVALGGIATALTLWQTADDGLLFRARGGAVDPAIELTYLVEVPGSPAERTTEARIAADAMVIFRVRTRDGGFLCLDEQGRDGGWSRLLPAADSSWGAPAGAHLAQVDGEIQAFRSDLGPGRRAYRAVVDPHDPDCSRPSAESTVELEWLE